MPCPRHDRANPEEAWTGPIRLLHHARRVSSYERLARVMDGSCVFCEIVAGTSPSRVVHQDDRTVAFRDIGQAATGHTLVVPQQHVRNLLDCPPDLVGAVFAAASEVARLLLRVLQPRDTGCAKPVRRQSALGWIQSGASVTLKTYARRYGVDRRTAHEDLTALGFPRPASAEHRPTGPPDHPHPDRPVRPPPDP